MSCKPGRLEDIQVLLDDCRRRGEVPVDCFKTDWVRCDRCFTQECAAEAGLSVQKMVQSIARQSPLYLIKLSNQSGSGSRSRHSRRRHSRRRR